MPTEIPDFIPGLELNRRFYQEVVAPILGSRFSDLPHAAALIGYGSDVLGFDTPMSTDHNWGPRLQLFLRPKDHQQHSAAIDKVLRQELPITFLGYPVNFGEPDWSDGGTQRMEPVSVGPVRHMIELVTVDEYFHKCLGVDPEEAPDAIGWLTLAEQALLEMTSGEVFHDGLGDLTAARARLAYYPRDVWLVRMAAQWKRIGQEEAFVGRCGDAGDDLGSRIVAARLVRDLMRLAFLMERRYAPYSKWLGTAFAQLACAPRLWPLFQAVLAGGDWQARQQPLAKAYELMARMHNALGVTPPVDPSPRLFFNRPFLVLFADRFVDALGDAVEDEALQTLPPLGGVDQFADCTDLTEQPLLLQRLRVLYNAPDS